MAEISNLVLRQSLFFLVVRLQMTFNLAWYNSTLTRSADDNAILRIVVKDVIHNDLRTIEELCLL
jgi:hypothetical protein